MNTLSFTQPWGALVAIGAKTIETRGWAPPHESAIGKPLAIHVSKAFPGECRDLVKCKPFESVLAAAGLTLEKLLEQRGKVIATTTLIGSRRMTAEWIAELRARTDHQTYLDLEFGAWESGRVAWFLADPKPLVPALARGSLGLWDWQPGSVVCCICEHAIHPNALTGALEDGGISCFPCWKKLPEPPGGRRKKRPTPVTPIPPVEPQGKLFG